MIDKLRQTRRELLRYFEMRPIHKVIRKLKSYDYLLMDNVLEVFGYKGEYHTLDYLKYVKQLDIWEIAQDCETSLKNNLPNANVKITNSYEEIKTTTKLFDTIIIDNHQGIFGNNKCEHFEIIEDCFKKLSNKAVLIANVIPNINRSKYNPPHEVKVNHIELRKQFYMHETGQVISHFQLKNFYTQMAHKNGYTPQHIFFVKRNYLMTYMVLCLQKGN